MIDKNSPIPVYYQLKQDFINKIKEGLWSSGQCIESERELSEFYGVSRMTIRQALGELVQEGLLIREKGKGTFVCDPKVKQKDMMSFSEVVEKAGMNLKTEILEFEKINTPEDLKDIFGFELLYKINRMRIVDDVPVANEIVYVPCDYCGYIDKEMLKGSLFKLLENFGHKISHSESSIQGVLMDDYYKEIFKADKCVPLMKSVSNTITEDNKVIFVEEAVYRSDKYVLQVNILRKEGKFK
ncbi:GntR family transcriptional regulator [Clostridium polynesiense]|uniref:GntR family transcriptional regulator n=1 Tax=Clostridium polynesiense TaxID=1325933 RepID=UPI00058FAB62|nr:GntR family transcriptional regulator [Clostridium polynesiense]